MGRHTDRKWVLFPQEAITAISCVTYQMKRGREKEKRRQREKDRETEKIKKNKKVRQTKLHQTSRLCHLSLRNQGNQKRKLLHGRNETQS